MSKWNIAATLERFCIRREGGSDWKNITFLGSKLDTESDISRRKGLASAAWDKNSSLLTTKTLPLTLRASYLETFVSSIFLYQCCIWTLTVKREREIDIIQRRYLRRLIGIRYPKKITNNELYKITRQTPWSVICKKED